MQDARLAAEAYAQRAMDDMRRAAFIGWQFRVSNWGDPKRQPPDFQKYLRQLGIPDSVPRRAEGSAPSAAMERVRAAFAKKGASRWASG